MADFNKAFEILMKLEFSNCKNALHKNPTEDMWTFMGIYQKYNPHTFIWDKVKELMNKYKNKKKVSCILYNDPEIINEVKRITKQKYWDIAKLDKVKSQQIANEILVFGFNTNPRKAIRLAQKIVGVKPDGIVGNKTLAAFNNYNEKLFDILYDAGEAEFYESLIKAKKKFKIYEDGWLNRAKRV